MVTTAPAATTTLRVVCPAHASVTVDATVPPLYARTLTSRRGVTKLKLPLLWPADVKLTLFVVNKFHGPE
jgi:hypothetical protein